MILLGHQAFWTKNPKGQFKRSLASVWQNRVLSHFQFAERFHKNTIYREQFMKSYGVDKKSICLLRIIHYGRDLEPKDLLNRGLSPILNF